MPGSSDAMAVQVQSRRMPPATGHTWTGAMATPVITLCSAAFLQACGSSRRSRADFRRNWSISALLQSAR